jgi:hypothetical protein
VRSVVRARSPSAAAASSASSGRRRRSSRTAHGESPVRTLTSSSRSPRGHATSLVASRRSTAFTKPR